MDKEPLYQGFVYWRVAVRTFTALVPLFILSGYCAICEPVPLGIQSLLGAAALLSGAGAVADLQSICRGKGPSPWADLSTIVVVTVGIAFLAISTIGGHTPCMLCAAFWGAQAMLAVELVLSNRRVAGLSRLAFVTACVGGLLCLTPTSRSFIRESLPSNESARQIATLGAHIPVDLAMIPDNGLLLIAPTCTDCWRGPIERHLHTILATQPSPTVVTLKENVSFFQSWPTLEVLAVDRKVLEALGVGPLAPPVLAHVEERVFVRVQPLLGLAQGEDRGG
jgi:hypothetical protein